MTTSNYRTTVRASGVPVFYFKASQLQVYSSWGSHLTLIGRWVWTDFVWVLNQETIPMYLRLVPYNGKRTRKDKCFP